MSPIPARFFALALALVAACTLPGTPRAPQSELERMVFFAERDRGGKLHEISGAVGGPEAGGVRHVPWDHPVDINSLVEIRLDKGGLPPASASASGPLADESLDKRLERLKAALRGLGDLIALRREAQRTWRTLEEADSAALGDVALEKRMLDEFDSAVKRMAGRKKGFLEALQALYPDTVEGLADRRKVEQAVRAMLGSKDDGAPLADFLQGEIDTLDRATRSEVERARAQGRSIRLEAFLVPTGENKEPAAIHLEGYDEIDAKEVRVIDRFGLKLSEPERRRLESMLASAKEIADAANRVRDGDAQLGEALRDATSDLGRKLGAYAAEADAVVREWGPKRRDEDWKATVDAVDPFVDAVKNAVQGVSDGARDKLRTEAKKKLAEWASQAEFASSIVEALEMIPKARDAWNAANGSRMDSALTLTIELAGKLEAVGANLEQIRDVLALAEQVVQGAIADWKALLQDDAARKKLDEAYAHSDLKTRLEAWRDLVARSRKIALPVARYVGLARTRPLGASIRAPGAIDVPIDDAPNTSIDLTRAERKPGDRVEVRASIVEDGRAKGVSHASFELEKLGWHADLVPAVVLTTADQLAGADDSGGFTASISWMLRYGARPDETGALADSARWLGWGVGLHATLLNFDPKNDAEIGLGLTVGLWGDRLLLGAGVNALANSDQEGRYYYFIGSSLIPLLQALESK